MSHAILLPDDVYATLASYAAKHQQTPDDALFALIQRLSPPQIVPLQGQ